MMGYLIGPPATNLPTYTVEKRCPHRGDDRQVEEWTGLTLLEAIDRIDDLIGVDDPDGIGELEPGEGHKWTDEENGDETEVRRLV